MSTAPPVARRPSSRRYVVAGLLAAVALVAGTVVAVIIGRALVGYDITPFTDGSTTTVTVGDRGEAIWSSPERVVVRCASVDDATGEASMSGGTASMTTTRSGRTWTRVGIVEGEPGSRHTVRCAAGGGDALFGHAPNPRIARYVTIGVVGGGVAGLLAVAAFVLALVTAIQRSRRPA
ncbi:hypothetical protein [Aeromicrobium yanjiei]|uniref:Serine/arginine repetitive matrix protein 2 n=1 Tax=Aeromicrobium yanjiei TaxID=2662028 RepID=A0A5Q2MFI3_9ACTN|nr:hypothetical protein [Aeromicrobium yanjiei]QGG40483.1 hypothetical protein GEV26_03365 [Aeromicrobium yanjiei]